MNRGRPWTPLAVLLVTAAGPAQAHLMGTGLGPFYDGAAHFLLDPAALPPVIGLTLLAGLRGPAFGRAVLLALPAAWLTGSLAAALAGLTDGGSPVTSALLAIGLGVLAASDRALPLSLVIGLAMGVGLLLGLGGDLGGVSASGLSGSLGVVPLAGSLCALVILVALIAGQTASLRAIWARTAARAAGSWIAAIGLLSLGWALRGA